MQNEAGTLEELYQRIKDTMEKQEKKWELVLVNDGSTDDTMGILDSIYESDPRLTVVHLRRNYGQTAALMAGFDHARGEVVVAMDGDLQHAPEEIPIQDMGRYSGKSHYGLSRTFRVMFDLLTVGFLLRYMTHRFIFSESCSCCAQEAHSSWECSCSSERCSQAFISFRSTAPWHCWRQS